MKRIRFVMATILATGLGVHNLLAAETAKEVANDKVVAEDFAKLSNDGHLAFEDIELARQAIYDGDTQSAVKLVAEAQQALTRAKADDSQFLKAASELSPAPKTSADAAKPEADAAKSVAWIPVDSEFVLNENLAGSRVKSAAVATANRHLRQGKAGKAHEVLKVTGAEADFILVVAPLQDTIDTVAHAASLLESHDYYNANLALKQAQDGLRFISKDVIATPKKKDAAKEEPKTGGTKPEAK
ncbi:YfdX family protein [Beijerinckia indica]|uniref:YfdX family protein n=1 Tax=Beijerinckia indica subsp. indica (strain ATCC 9039 / DSM 1715 / NCIMB 8712) TaxID=395963 RepID=B2ICT8_BEII9|nr:YfdX family protein [Beijerinckia indica]ACB95362.1 conserved hypothetical protein [Beijerinckia indica subsp. indica ATCC 9039]